MDTGYSGTPLAKKLGIFADARVVLLGEPDRFTATLEPLPPRVTLRGTLAGGADIVVLFTTERDDLERRVVEVGRAIVPSGALWVAWPKKASKVPTDVTEDVVRSVALPLGLVDNKVCAIDATWSGLRLVIRREHR